MTQLIGQGGTITLDAKYQDVNGIATDPVDPRVSILDPMGATVVDLAVPTRVGVGLYQYAYAVAADAPMGAWQARWYGLINSVQVGPVDDGFTVTASGVIVPGSASGATTCSPWATFEDAPASITELYAVDPDDVDEAFSIATGILYELSGRVYPGICSDVIRPQAQWSQIERGVWMQTLPASILTAAPWGWCGCHRGRDTGCASVPEIKLPGHPVQRAGIVVKIDGSVFTSWELHDGRYLVRTDGLGWPCCQNLRVDDTQERTFSIAYPYGRLPDKGGKRAAIMLGSQLFVQFNPEFAAACKIPKRATQVVRQGITIQLKSVKDMIDAGLTGIDFVDLWISSKKVGKATRPATVMVPAHARARSARRIGR